MTVYSNLDQDWTKLFLKAVHMDYYNIGDLANLFDISSESLRKWTIEFSKYMSPTSNPGEGKTRLLTEDDVRILSLVAERRRAGVAMQNIHGELENGGRGILPDIEASMTNAIITDEQARHMALENEMLRDQIATYRARLEQLEDLRERQIRSEVQMEMERQRAEKAEAAVDKLIDDRRELDREIVRLKMMLENYQSSKSDQ